MDYCHDDYTRVDPCIVLMKQNFFPLHLRSCLLKIYIEYAQKPRKKLYGDRFTLFNVFNENDTASIPENCGHDLVGRVTTLAFFGARSPTETNGLHWSLDSGVL